MSRVLNVLLTHQPLDRMERMLAWWRDYCPPENVLVVFNGAEETLARLDHPHKTRVDDPRLRTVKHARERQSYTEVWRAVARWLPGRDYTHVHFAEYDQIPLVADLNARQVASLEQERADVLAFQLQRVDGTSQPHFLYHAHLSGFSKHWESFSVRHDPQVVLSMFGTGSFWTRAAFEATAAQAEPFPIYLELYLPTTAHHLGYRLRDWGGQNRHITSLGDYADHIEQARRDGAWTLHPVKTLWAGSAGLDGAGRPLSRVSEAAVSRLAQGRKRARVVTPWAEWTQRFRAWSADASRPSGL